MGTTPNALPYPEGTDKVVDGDDAIKALALALDPLVLGRSWSVRKGSAQSFPSSTYFAVLSVTLPASTIAGLYEVRASAVTYSSASTSHFRKVSWGAQDLPGGADSITAPAGLDVVQPTIYATVVHPGGAVTVTLSVQVNGANAIANPNCSLQVARVGSGNGSLLSQPRQDDEGGTHYVATDYVGAEPR